MALTPGLAPGFGAPLAICHCDPGYAVSDGVPGSDHVPRRGQTTLKRLILTALFAVLVTPYIASARDWNDHDRNRHRKIGANQMAAVGLAGAALIGVAGYLVLRKRTTV